MRGKKKSKEGKKKRKGGKGGKARKGEKVGFQATPSKIFGYGLA